MDSDLLGIQPKPHSGGRHPVCASEELEETISKAKKAIQSIWVDTPDQVANISLLREYRLEALGQWGEPMDGRVLIQVTQAGKSAIAWRLKSLLTQARINAGGDENPYQVLIITIKKGMTIKGFLLAVLKQMGDPFLEHRQGQPERQDRRSIELLERRVGEWASRLGVEILFVDEVQRLASERSDAKQVTEQFQTMLDRGVAPLVLLGNADLDRFIRLNPELGARLTMPLQLRPLESTDVGSAGEFQDFCEGFDMQLIEKGIFDIRSDLDEPEIAVGLREVSGGHAGRVARIIREAAASALRRGAFCIEPFDLSNVTRDYAMRLGWIDYDPFEINHSS